MTKINIMSHQKQQTKAKTPVQFAFDKEKYIWLITGLIISLLGFVIMIGGKSDDPQVFNESIFNFQRITLAPILVLAGYGVVLYAILKKPKKK